MQRLRKKYDAIVIGGGIFGLYAAKLLSSRGAKVAVIEKEKTIMSRASKVNQARIHRGYHYPRSYETALKVSRYYDRFCKDFKPAILGDFKQYYAISKKGTKTTVAKYIRFCQKLNIPLSEVPASLFFKRNKIAALFEAEETCFDYTKIKEILLKELKSGAKIDIYCQAFPVAWKIERSRYVLTVSTCGFKLTTPMVVNATYSHLNEVNRFFGFPGHKIKYELCELQLGKPKNMPPNIGLTVVDGPFFSLMPFEDGRLYTLSSVSYTPVETSLTRPQEVTDLSTKLNGEVEGIAKSYLKNDFGFEYKKSLFEVKPILISSEDDDSRPTKLIVHSRDPFFLSVFAGKISTIYDLEEKLKKLPFGGQR